jgi:WhiB family transcriptional regulator, redox-sensing transcriptional regulator
VVSDTAWMERAACAGQEHVDMFDLDCGLEAAITLCAICPVGDLCLDYAIEHNLTDGIWGGEWGDTLIRLTRRTPGRVPNHG